MSAQQKNTAKLLSDVIGKLDGYSNVSKTTKTSFIRADQIVGAPFSVWRVKFGGNVLQCQEKLSHNIRQVCQQAGTNTVIYCFSGFPPTGPLVRILVISAECKTLTLRSVNWQLCLEDLASYGRH